MKRSGERLGLAMDREEAPQILSNVEFTQLHSTSRFENRQTTRAKPGRLTPGPHGLRSKIRKQRSDESDPVTQLFVAGIVIVLIYLLVV